MLKVNKLSDDASLPTRAHVDDAGADLKSSESLTILPNTRACVSTGISIEIIPPENLNNQIKYYARIAARSGLSIRNNIDIGAGVIDMGFRGEIKVVVINNSNVPFIINKGDKIAQLIIELCLIPDIIEDVELSNTIRGDNGFGSTGKN